jgi:hypothetical protein
MRAFIYQNWQYLVWPAWLRTLADLVSQIKSEHCDRQVMGTGIQCCDNISGTGKCMFHSLDQPGIGIKMFIIVFYIGSGNPVC